jgi:two-component sensor histidine kinase
MENEIEGVFLILKRDGTIEKVTCYGTDIPHGIGSFASLMDHGSREKASNFLDRILEKGAAYNWEMNLRDLKTYHFSGFLNSDRIYVVGSPSREDMINIYHLAEEYMSPEPEIELPEHTEVEKELFNELTRLNNELSSAQRELLKKNLELQRALEEKEMLLREINHRVKNNLMIISSILNLQSRYVKDRDDLTLFNEAQSKARAMAMLHERLYTSGKHRSVDFGEYLRGLLRDLYCSFIQDTSHIGLETDIDDAELDVNIVVPLALIVNEVFTNAIKHGFPHGQSGTIRASFKRMNGEYLLEIADNGVGLPEDFDPEGASTLGMQLVRSLSEQINGDLKIESNGGTRISIKFTDWKQ